MDQILTYAQLLKPYPDVSGANFTTGKSPSAPLYKGGYRYDDEAIPTRRDKVRGDFDHHRCLKSGLGVNPMTCSTQILPQPIPIDRGNPVAIIGVYPGRRLSQ